VTGTFEGCEGIFVVFLYVPRGSAVNEPRLPRTNRNSGQFRDTRLSIPERNGKYIEISGIDQNFKSGFVLEKRFVQRIHVSSRDIVVDVVGTFAPTNGTFNAQRFLNVRTIQIRSQ